MKMVYISPALEVVQLDTEQSLMTILAGSSTEAGTGSGSAGDEDPECGTKRRGSWGNLWE